MPNPITPKEKKSNTNPVIPKLIIPVHREKIPLYGK